MKTLYVRTLEAFKTGGRWDDFINPTSFEFKPSGEFEVVTEDNEVYVYPANTLHGYHTVTSLKSGDNQS